MGPATDGRIQRKGARPKTKRINKIGELVNVVDKENLGVNDGGAFGSIE